MSNISIFLAILICFSIDAHAQWTELLTEGAPGRIRALATNGSNLFAGSDYGVFRSTNGGVNWAETSSGLAYTYLRSLIADRDNLFAGTDSGVFRSTDSGTSWQEANAGLAGNLVSTFAESRGILFAGTEKGVFRSTNHGASWVSVNSGLKYPEADQANAGLIPPVTSFAVSGSNLLSGSYGAGVFISTNNGKSWSFASKGLPPHCEVMHLAVCGNTIFAAGISDGAFLSTDNGKSWSVANTGLPPDANVISFGISGMNVFAGTGSGWGPPKGIFVSTNNGVSWNTGSNGLPKNGNSYPFIQNFTVIGNRVLALLELPGKSGQAFWWVNNGELKTLISKSKQAPTIAASTSKLKTNESFSQQKKTDKRSQHVQAHPLNTEGAPELTAAEHSIVQKDQAIEEKRRQASVLARAASRNAAGISMRPIPSAIPGSDFWWFRNTIQFQGWLNQTSYALFDKDGKVFRAVTPNFLTPWTAVAAFTSLSQQMLAAVEYAPWSTYGDKQDRIRFALMVGAHCPPDNGYIQIILRTAVQSPTTIKDEDGVMRSGTLYTWDRDLVDGITNSRVNIVVIDPTKKIGGEVAFWMNGNLVSH